jgi:phage portal protein BeeE
MRQGIRTLGEPSKHFERLVFAGLLDHGGHPVLRWMAGNVVVHFDRNLNFMPAKDQVAPRRSTASWPASWRRPGLPTWTQDGRRFENVAQSEIFHVRGFGGSPLGGLSTLALGRQVFGLARAENRAAAGTFKNGLRPSGVLTLPAVPQGRAAQGRRGRPGTQVRRGAVNAAARWSWRAAPPGRQLSINPEDAQMLQSRAFSIEEVCRFFGVPPFMIGHTEKTTSWGTGLSEQQSSASRSSPCAAGSSASSMSAEKQLLTPRTGRPASPSSSTWRACCAATAPPAPPSTTQPSTTAG